MNTFRSTVMAVATSAACLSLVACSAAITTVSPARSASPAVGRAPSSSAMAASRAAPGCAVSGGLVTVDAPVGSFPVPPGAQVVGNFIKDKAIEIILSSVTRAQMSAFYTSALPRAGYTIAGNITSSEGATAGTIELITFTGHGYKGEVAAGKMPSGRPPADIVRQLCPGATLSGLGQNTVVIALAAS